MLKTIDDAIKTVDDFNKNRADMEKTVVDIETAMAKLQAVAKQYGDTIDGNAFGLDPKEAKQKKIITDVTKTTLDGLQVSEDSASAWSELDGQTG